MPTDTRIHTAAPLIEAREPFVSGGRYYPDVRNLRGGPNEGTVGRLPIALCDRFYADANEIDYVVYSYHTPIAWHTPAGWTVPPVKYSPSTHRHQLLVLPLASI